MGLLEEYLGMKKPIGTGKGWAGLAGLSQGLLAAGAPRVGAPGPNAWGAGITQMNQAGKEYEATERAKAMEALQKQAIEMKIAEAKVAQQRQLDQERALNTIRMGGVSSMGGQQDPAAVEGAYATLAPKEFIKNKLNPGGDMPMNIKEWREYIKMSKPDQERYLAMKRAQKTVDLGARYGFVSPTRPGVVLPMAGGEKSLPPEAMPETRRAQAAAAAEGEAVGKEQGETKARLAAALATYPKLEGVVNKLSALGKKASYTWADRASDEIAIQAGGEASEGAIARGEYIATVKNNILPLLRQTFGAAFTAQEGESLLATLGDPNMHPSVKDAVLKSFIEQKYAEIQAMERQVGGGNGKVDLVKKYGLVPKK